MALRNPAIASAGTWKEEGETAVITWNTGWTTKITREDDHYKKTAFRKGQSLDGPPVNSSDGSVLRHRRRAGGRLYCFSVH